MKLNEIKELNVNTIDLMEGVIPVHLTMTLEQVVRSGRISNSVQTFIIADLVSLFKDGGPSRWPRDLNPYPMNADSGLIEAIRSLDDNDAADLASWLLTELQNPATFESTPLKCCNPAMNAVEWTRWVLKRQD